MKCIEDQRKEFIEAYEKKVKRETERMKSIEIYELFFLHIY